MTTCFTIPNTSGILCASPRMTYPLGVAGAMYSRSSGLNDNA